MRKLAVSVVLLMTLGCFRVISGYGLAPAANLDVAGPGPITNLSGSNLAQQNFMQHLIASAAIPATCHALWGWKVMRDCALAWAAYTLLEEGLWHCPANAGLCRSPAGYPAEVRADLISRLTIPALLILLYYVRPQ